MSSPEEWGNNPSRSFLRNLVRAVLWMLLFGIVGPLFVLLYLAIEPNDEIGWMLWTGLAVTVLDVGLGVLVAAGWTRNARRIPGSSRSRRTVRKTPAPTLAAAPTTAPPEQRPTAERLAELDDLMRRDLLGREEYDEARARILREL